MSRRGTSRRHSWLEDLGSGVLSLLLALVVWVVAVYEQDAPREDYFEGIPIKYINMGSGLELVGPREERVDVTLRAPSSRWSALKAPAALEATVDLRGLGEGVHTLEVQVRAADRAAMIVKRTPARVVVRLEQTVRREVDVQPVVVDADSVPPGYSMATPRVNPGRVTIAGPRSLVDSVVEVVARVWLRGSKTNVESTVAPLALDKDGQVVADVNLAPRTVAVTLMVEPMAEFRDVTVRAVLKGAPAAGYWVSNITVEPAAVTVQGKPEIIRTIPAVVSTVPIDITGLKESQNKRVGLTLPEGVTVYSTEASGQGVTVRIEVTAIQGGKTVQPRVEVLNLRSGLTATLAPDSVDVILSGPMPDLQALQAEDVRVVVNLFGLGVGRHRVTPTILLPEGTTLKVESVAPDAVEVVISASARGGP